MAAQPQPEQHDVWPLLLQHPALARWPHAVCALAAACRGLRAAVQQHCVGALVLRVQLFDGHEAAQLARWLAPNGRLVRKLRLRAHVSSENVSVAPLVAALQQAATAAGGLQLRALVTETRFRGSSSMLAPWLPACHLTCLELQFDWQEQHPFDSSHAAALAALTGLQQLVLHVRGSGRVDLLLPLLPALRGLSRLTALELSPVRSAAGVASLGHQLPGQLQRLKLGLALSARRPPLELGRLSALTALSSSGSVNSDPFSLQLDDVLPPHLCELRGVRDCTPIAPLLPLAQLRLLELGKCRAPAERLRQLSSVGALGQPGGELQLAFESAAANAAAAAWPLLPLRSLGVSGGVSGGVSSSDRAPLAAAALAHLATASGLTRLALDRVQLEAPASRFAADVLVRLSRLEELQLWNVRFRAEEPPPAPGGGQALGEAGAQQQQEDAAQAGGVQLCAAIAALPRLQALWLNGLHPKCLCSAAAATQLAAATGLTSLRLGSWSQLGDVGAAAVLPALCQLRKLDLPGCGLTDAGMAIVAGLSGLTALNPSRNFAVTAAGIDCLIAGLLRLRKCICRDTGMSLAARARLEQHCARVANAAAEADAEAE